MDANGNNGEAAYRALKCSATKGWINWYKQENFGENKEWKNNYKQHQMPEN